jgi:3D (Asp-Asp-Asp) domain-containing protein
MTRWLEKWIIPITLALLLLYCSWAFYTINQSIEEYEARVEKAAAEPERAAEAPEEPAEPKAPEKTPEPIEEPVVEEKPQPLGTFKLTAYCACPKCCGQWADGITFTGTKATQGRTVAVDPAVIPLGSSVYINGQEYIAEDTGNAIVGNRVDVFFDSHAAALEFGVQYLEVSIN